MEDDGDDTAEIKDERDATQWQLKARFNVLMSQIYVPAYLQWNTYTDFLGKSSYNLCQLIYKAVNN